MDTVAFDSQLELVANEQRRELLISLLDTSPLNYPLCDGGVSMRDDDSERAVAMEHVHLPKLADADVVAWDRDADSVSRGPAFSDVEPLLLLLREHESDLSGQGTVT